MGYVTEQKSYFRAVYGRGAFKFFLIQCLLALCSPFRIILEVFIRRHMGERYFSGWTCLFWSIIFIGLGGYSLSERAQYVVPDYLYNSLVSIGIFGVLFFGFSIWRWIESYHNPSTVSFDKFSKSSGDPLFFFSAMLDNGTSPRLVEIWLEPLLFFVIGGVFCLVPGTFILGAFLVFCSIMYSLFYRANYSLSRDYILDIIDDKLSATLLKDYVKKGLSSGRSIGFQMRAPVAHDEKYNTYLSNLILKADPTGEPTSIAE